jgi:ribose transport system permease protein
MNSSAVSNPQKSANPPIPWGKRILDQSSLIAFVVMVLVSACLTDRFLSIDNITNILRQSVPLGVVSLGLLFVILTGGIDLSVGSLMALVSVVVALIVPENGLFLGVVAGILAGLVCGALSGVLVASLNIAPFIATLATMTITRGVALIVSKGQPIFIDDTAFNDFGVANWFGIPTTFYLLIVCFLIALFLYRKTVFGRLTISIGSNETATRFAGIRVGYYKFGVYALCGLACGIAGVIASTRTGVGSPVLALGFELDAIAAVVVGGANLSGGRGTVFNTLIGVMILSIISNVMNLMNIPGYHQQVVKGAIIILAVTLDSLKGRAGNRH